MSTFKKKEKILITSAIPYVNNVPHLGNLIGSALSADVFARYCRLAGHNTLFIYGTDEHGTATEIQALKEGIRPKELCKKYFAVHQDINKWFGINSDCFGGTSSPVHHELTKKIFNELDKNGYISEGELEQLYSPQSKMFLADRYVVGTCPHCRFEESKGDQCENCSKLLDAAELITPRSRIDNSPLEIRKSKHLFFDLPKLAKNKKLKQWFAEQSSEGHWTKNARTITEAWFREGFKKICITRDLQWGIKVPKKGYENKVFYVWFDAAIGYISATKAERQDWEDWWKNKKVKLYQFMAKDNIPFHTTVFPGELFGSDKKGKEWTKLYHINATEYLQYEDGKSFSKSRRTGVFANDAIESGIPADVWRYYLLAQRPEGADATFSWEDFQKRNNNELLATLGNFVNRTIVFKDKYLRGTKASKEQKEDKEFLAEINTVIKRTQEQYAKVELRDALRSAMEGFRKGNKYFQEQKPWELIKEDKRRCVRVLETCTTAIEQLAPVIEPVLPHTAEEIRKQVKTGNAKPLFRKLENKEIATLKKKFSGKQQSTNPEASFSQLTLKVGVIKHVDQHQNADKLYLISVGLGNEERTIVSGLRDHYKKEELLGKHVIVLTNLKAAKLRGVVSEGMLLAANIKKNEKEQVVVLEAPHSKAGEEVTIEGSTPSTTQITYDTFSKIRMIVKNKRATHNSKIISTKTEPVICDIANDATIR